MKNRIVIVGIAAVSFWAFFYAGSGVLKTDVYTVKAETAPPCGAYAISDAIDGRFGSPYNLVSGYKGLTIIPPGGCSTASPIIITIGNRPFDNMVVPPPSDRDPAPTIAAYKKMIVAKIVYIYSPGTTGWKPLTNITSPDNAFFNSTINATWDYGHIKVNAGTLAEGTHYILGYSCVDKSGAWKCGCKNAECTEQGWQIQKLTVTKPSSAVTCPPNIPDPVCGCGRTRYPYNCDPDNPSGPNPCYCTAL